MTPLALVRSILAVGALALAVPSSLAADFVDLTVGQSGIVRSSGEPGTVIVGDETIADATVGSGNLIILTGKGVGSTNLIVLDGAGAQLLNSTVLVGPVDRRPRSKIRVLKGGSGDQEYVCVAGAGCDPLSDAGGAQVAGSFGPCMRPGDVAADGSQCGGRAASVRPGGVDGEGQPEERH